MKAGLYLVHLDGQAVIARFTLFEGVHRIGRDPQSDIHLADHSVSRCHAELRISKPHIVIRDLKSRNGTFVEERPIRSCHLSPGQRIRFGEVALLLTTKVDFDPDFDSIFDTKDPRGTGCQTYQAPTLPVDHLSPAQQKVYQRLLKGLSEREVAADLGVSRHTVHHHITEIYRIFRIHKRAELFSHMLPKVDQTVILKRVEVRE